ncbi:DUF397 domain-containing protein [Saccharopolyspora sp. WRP15-2]|uniref:DUF397 domain-containing protein n=1 Tax=Saccharopolyspora oryzae TaxID=2997343 RepID=A0ABT4UT85_9PSEU|nr:DUF397 domain-containing protein [Saccharopolyspora oryzae]MDA3624908.1 DUF397 domain-containing protein [Saccharopolyspora oryzae]
MTSVSGWRKSSYSQNTDSCVEVGRTESWRKPSYSQPNGNCVEVGALSGGAAVRDTKDRDGGYFVTTPAQWADFVGAVKAGRFTR